MKNFLALKTNYIWKVNFILTMMSEEEKKECRNENYMHSRCLIPDEEECIKCKRSYGYVTAYNEGYEDSYEDNWHEWGE